VGGREGGREGGGGERGGVVEEAVGERREFEVGRNKVGAVVGLVLARPGGGRQGGREGGGAVKRSLIRVCAA